MRNKLLVLGAAAGLLFCFVVSLFVPAAAYYPEGESYTSQNAWYCEVYSPDYGDFVLFSLPAYSSLMVGVPQYIYDPDENLICVVYCSLDADTQNIRYDIEFESGVIDVNIFTNTISFLPYGEVTDVLAFKVDSTCEVTYSGHSFWMERQFSGIYDDVNPVYVGFTESFNYSNYDIWLVLGPPAEYRRQLSFLMDFGCHLIADRNIGYLSLVVQDMPMDTYNDVDSMRERFEPWSWRFRVIGDQVSSVNPVEWIGRMAEGILNLELFPGFTIGGISFAFLFVLVAIALLKLYAGG